MNKDFTEHIRGLGKPSVPPTVGSDAPVGPEPDPPDIPNRLPEVLPFDYTMLPPALRGYTKEFSQSAGAPPDYVGIALMVSLGSLLGNKVAIAPKSQDSWHEFPNLWGMAVGRPASMKSPSLTAGKAFLEQLEVRERAVWEPKVKQHELELKAVKLRRQHAEKKAVQKIAEGGEFDCADLDITPPPEPTLRRFQTQSANFASLHQILMQNPNGLLFYNDELAGLLGSFASDGGQELKALLLQLWAGKESFTADRIARGLNLHLPPTTISILGTTQPGRIGPFVRMTQTEGAGDDGFLQRFSLLVWPDPVRTFTNIDRSPNPVAHDEAAKVFAAFAAWAPSLHHAHVNDDSDGAALLRFDPEAAALFTAWREDLEIVTRSGELHPALESHFIKYRKAIPALALIYALAVDPEAEAVDREAMEAALRWDKYLRSHAIRFYSAGGGTHADAARAILLRLKKGDLDPTGELKPSPIVRKGWTGLTDGALVTEALRLLEDHHWVTFSEVRNPAGGRPTESWRLTARAVAKLTTLACK
jgi:putative DNA primase/helicase